MTIADLSLPVSEDLPTFPGSPAVRFVPWNIMREDYYNLELLFMSSHTGTHVDAPYHFDKNGKKLHEFPLSYFHTKATKIVIPDKSPKIEMEDIRDHELAHGEIKKCSSVVFQTNWDAKLETAFYFERNPGITESVAKYLVSQGIKLVGIDSPNIDEGIKQRRRVKHPVHKILAKNNILIVENLTNLIELPPSFTLIVLPLSIRGTSGSPVRAIAVY